MDALPDTLHQLRGLLEVSRLVREGVAGDDLLAAVTRVIGDVLGFATVATNVVRPAQDELEVAAVHGPDAARAALLHTRSRRAAWLPLLDQRFACGGGGARFIPAGTIDWDAQEGVFHRPHPSDVRDGPPERRWQSEDALFVPLQRRDGSLLAVLSVDEPRSGLRPSEAELEVLVAVATHAGEALEAAQLAESAAHRSAALERLPAIAALARDSLDPAPVLAAVVRTVQAQLRYRHVELVTLRAARTAHEAGDHLLAEGPAVLRAAHAAGRERGGCLVLDPAAAAELRGGNLHRDPRAGPAAWNGHLLTAVLRDRRGHPLGLLACQDPEDGLLPSDDALRLLAVFADQAAAALDSAGQEAVRRSETRKAAMLEGALDGIVTVDRSGRIVEFNPAAEALFGLPAGAALGADATGLLVPPAFKDELRAGLLAIADGHLESRRFELAGLKADGEIFTAEVSLIPSPADGEPLVTCFLRDVTEQLAGERLLRRERDRARRRATHDRLTGLPNREGTEAWLEGRLETGAVHELLSIGLTGLRMVNDSLGHAAGDQALRAVVERLGAVAAGPDALLARLTGPELLLAATCPDGEAIARAVHAALAAPLEVAGMPVRIGARVGLVAPMAGESATAVVTRAAMALGEARRRDLPVHRFAAGDEGPAGRLHLAEALRHAIDGGELELHYQPIAGVEDGRPAALEALVRWRREGRLVPPAEFVPFAEETGLVVPLGTWVLDEACRQLALWRRDAGLELCVTVNVSPLELHRRDLAADVATALRRHGVPGRCLVIELTEGALRTDVVTAIEQLSELGVRCAIDDFGADWSSLSRLRDLPAHVLKVDRSFLATAPEDARARHVLASIVSLASGLGLTVIAEGVEREEQRALLGQLGVRLCQGFLIARPAPAAEALAWVRAAQAGVGGAAPVAA